MNEFFREAYYSLQSVDWLLDHQARPTDPKPTKSAWLKCPYCIKKSGARNDVEKQAL